MSRYEKGENNIPMPKARRLALLFGVTVDYLMGYDREDPEPTEQAA